MNQTLSGFSFLCSLSVHSVERYCGSYILVHRICVYVHTQMLLHVVCVFNVFYNTRRMLSAVLWLLYCFYVQLSCISSIFYKFYVWFVSTNDLFLFSCTWLTCIVLHNKIQLPIALFKTYKDKLSLFYRYP